MKLVETMMAAGTLVLLSTAAGAAVTPLASVRNLPQGSAVTVAGTVENFDQAHSFILRDASGTIKIDLKSSAPVVLKDGEKVSVAGKLDKGIFTTEISALSVAEDKGLGQQIGEAVDSVTGTNAGAQTVSIQALPASGLIKVNGTVEDVDGAKSFTLKDSTGHVPVTIKSGESASLARGTPVTVIGYANQGLGGKNIEATEVDLRSDSSPMAHEEMK